MSKNPRQIKNSKAQQRRRTRVKVLDEPPSRSPPWVEKIVLAVAAWLNTNGHKTYALCIFLGFHNLLKTRELTSLRWSSFTMAEKSVMINLNVTDTGHHTSYIDTVSVTDPKLVVAIRRFFEFTPSLDGKLLFFVQARERQNTGTLSRNAGTLERQKAGTPEHLNAGTPCSSVACPPNTNV